VASSSRIGACCLGGALAVASVACASAWQPALTPPEKGGAAWIELSTPRFRLETDVDRRTADLALEALERSHAILAHVMQRPPSAVDTQVEVVLFARSRDGAEVLPKNAGAVFRQGLPADVEDQPVVVMVDSELAADTRLTIQHELAHRFLRERLQSIPVWLNEGLAQYYSSARVEGDRIVLGGPSHMDFWDRRYFGMAAMDGFDQTEVPVYLAPTVQQLIDATRTDFYTTEREVTPTKEIEASTASYAASFRLVHLLMNGPNAADRAAFVAFLGALSRGQRAHEAFAAQFGPAPTRLEEAYRAYIHESALSPIAVRRPPEAPPRPPCERQLSAADVHVLWARLLPWRKDSMDRVRQQLEAARATAPESVDLKLVSAKLAGATHDFVGAKRELDKALAAAPQDPRCLLAHEQWHRAEARSRGLAPEAAEEAIPIDVIERLARVAVSATELNEVAWYYATHHRPDEGIPFSMRSLRADPICWSCQDTYAILLLEKGRTEEALRAIERAVSLIPETTSAPGVIEHRRVILAADAARKAAP
jgi:tetratricopeptide (TPR) repeat protein